MKVGSLFAGIGGFDLGFERAGFDVSWCVEIDKNARAVLARRFPQARILEDIREVDPSQLEPVDVICGGFPCQDLSVAGKRAGLAGERSGLFHDAMRIVRAVRPRMLVLENVPGLLSSNRGLDFATVLREVGEGWNCAEVGWRVLDSQYFGVAQRRRRVFVIAGSRIGCAEEVLALAEGSGGDPPSRGEAREAAAADAARCADVGRIAPALTSKMAKGTGGPSGDECQNLVAQAYRWQNDRDGLVPDDVVGGLRSSGGSSGFHKMNHPVIAQAFRKSKRAQTASDDETWVDDGLANTLNGFDPTLRAMPHDGSHANGGGHVAVAMPMIVRRLTPVECERLQGFPDGWTDIGTPERPTADSHRYKQLGNAVTVNVAEWIARRAHEALARETR